jgi:hypothetical protein
LPILYPFPFRLALVSTYIPPISHHSSSLSICNMLCFRYFYYSYEIQYKCTWGYPQTCLIYTNVGCSTMISSNNIIIIIIVVVLHHYIWNFVFSFFLAGMLKIMVSLDFL